MGSTGERERDERDVKREKQRARTEPFPPAFVGGAPHVSNHDNTHSTDLLCRCRLQFQRARAHTPRQIAVRLETFRFDKQLGALRQNRPTRRHSARVWWADCKSRRAPGSRPAMGDGAILLRERRDAILPELRRPGTWRHSNWRSAASSRQQLCLLLVASDARADVVASAARATTYWPRARYHGAACDRARQSLPWL